MGYDLLAIIEQMFYNVNDWLVHAAERVFRLSAVLAQRITTRMISKEGWDRNRSSAPRG
jgi:hypothetical protein